MVFVAGLVQRHDGFFACLRVLLQVRTDRPMRHGLPIRGGHGAEPHGADVPNDPRHRTDPGDEHVVSREQ